MRTHRLLFVVLLFVVLMMAATSVAQQPSQWDAVKDAMGQAGQPQEGGGMKFGMPRSDMNVRIGDVQLKPTLALGSWVAFDSPGKKAMVMGDLVLSESEVAPVIEKLQSKGIEITGIHNHLLGETPRVTYVHIGGHGDAVSMAASIREAISLTKTPRPTPSPEQQIDLPTDAIGKILGGKGRSVGGVLQFSIPRPDNMTHMGRTIPTWMGLGTAINFQPVGKGRAAITGDFVLAADEVNPVLRTLVEYGISVTALHSHMLDEEPRLLFMHFWAVNDAQVLAKGLRQALDKVRAH
jgi:hypothetical protein